MKTNEAKPLPLMSPLEIIASGEEYDAEMDRVFVHDPKRRTITINAKYPYEIDLGRIPSYGALLQWVHHLCEKQWMTGDLVGEFIERVCDIKKWDLHRKSF